MKRHVVVPHCWGNQGRATIHMATLSTQSRETRGDSRFDGVSACGINGFVGTPTGIMKRAVAQQRMVVVKNQVCWAGTEILK